MVPPALTYRARLRTEGTALAACGLVGSLLLLLADERTTFNATSTVVQLVIVALLLATLGPRGVRTAMAEAEAVGAPAPSTSPRASGEPTGEPTPLWHLPLIVAVLAGPLAAVDAWDAALRVTLGCTLVGLAQAVLLARLVAAEEGRTGRRFVRLPGSRILRGTRLGALPADAGAR